MFRRNDRFHHLLLRCLALVMLSALMQNIAHARADDVADFLERHGMKSLLAAHLEQQIEVLRSDERTEAVLRLAALYAELLESATDPAQRQTIEARARRVLERAPAHSADDLRLALLRASYRAVEKVAESHRVRLAGAADVATARRTLDEILPHITTLRQRLKANVELTERRLSRANPAGATPLNESSERAQQLLAQCTFMHAWALYYQSWLSGTDASAKLAEPLFADMLLADVPFPQPHEVSTDLRENEAVARAILGLALCKSITSSSATALSWIRLLEHENTFEALRTQAPGWKLAIHLEHRDFQAVVDLLRMYQDHEIPVAWLRLIAVYAIEDSALGGRSRLAQDLARRAVLDLGVRGELAQVLDLAQRYGTDLLGQSGFTALYVHGLIAYQRARDAHGSETPTLEPALVARYREAAEKLRAALSERDAINYATAAASCRRLVAWCSYFQCEFLEARRGFEEAAGQLDPKEAAESLWMAIVSLNAIAQAANDPTIQRDLDQLSERYINQFPYSERAATLRLRRVLARQDISERAVEELLAIPANSELHEIAQRRAAEILYQLFRRSAAQDRRYVAGRFLVVALPLISRASRSAETAEEGATERFVIRCRQVLEVSLHDEVERVEAARAALAALREMRDVDGVNLDDLADEIACRTAQERLLANDVATAAAMAEQLWQRDSASTWARLLARSMFRYGHQLWKGESVADEQQRLAMDLVARHGGRVLHEFSGGAEALNQPGALAYHVAVAEASMMLWEQYGDAERGKAALYLYEKLLAARPRNAAFLRAAALLAAKFGELGRALECWRILAAGTEATSPGWFEARYHTIQLLITIDITRARAVMNQHKQLHPDYGPPPWGALLKGLDVQLQNTS